MPSPIAMPADLSLGRLPSPVLPASSSPKNEYTAPVLSDLLSLEVYHRALEDERQKIKAFKRELPFCMQLLNDAIEASRVQLADRSPVKVRTPLQFRCNPYSDPHLRTSLPGLGEFLNLKRKWERLDDQLDRGKEQPAKRSANGPVDGKVAADICLERRWNVATPHGNLEKDSFRKECCELQKVKHEVLESEDCGTIVPPDKVDQLPSQHGISGAREVIHLSTSSLDLHSVQMPNIATDIRNKDRNAQPLATVEKRSQSGQPQRKPRRNWSPELHQRFLSALNRLGGSQAATPKQIRELMNVEGLTNDEVKSHLQKFRLHMRRPNSASQFDRQQGSGHLVVFGGIWVPPECRNRPTVAAAAAHQVSELRDSSMRKSSRLVAESLLVQDFFSNWNTTANLDAPGDREHRQSQLVCRNLMAESARCRGLDSLLHGSQDEDAKSESTSLNEEEEDDKTENHLERFRGFPCVTETSGHLRAEGTAAGTDDEVNECDSNDLSREDSCQRETAISPVHTALALKSFLADSMHLSGDASSQPQTGQEEVLCEETSSAVRSSTVLKELDPLARVANSIVGRESSESLKLEDVGLTSETELSIGCPLMQRSKEVDDDNCT